MEIVYTTGMTASYDDGLDYHHFEECYDFILPPANSSCGFPGSRVYKSVKDAMETMPKNHSVYEVWLDNNWESDVSDSLIDGHYRVVGKAKVIKKISTPNRGLN